MANELSITYNGQTKTKDSGVVLSTAGRVMVTDMTITAAADPHTLYTPSSTYFKTGTSGAVSAASVPSGKYTSATYYVKSASHADPVITTATNSTGLAVTAKHTAAAGWVTAGTTTATYTVPYVTPAFIGGVIGASGNATYTSANINASTINTSGIYIRPGADVVPTRSSVLYEGAVAGYIEKANSAVALESETGSTLSVTGDTIYITGVTVPSGKTFLVNGGGDKGVKVEYKKVTVDTYPVTDTNGDLLVPTYSGTSLTYPAPGIFSDSASTTTMTIQGNVTSINGLTVKDVNAVPGSGTAPSDVTYNYYLAKWQTAASLTTGPKVTISTSTPSGGSNGDIWYQVLS